MFNSSWRHVCIRDAFRKLILLSSICDFFLHVQSFRFMMRRMEASGTTSLRERISYRRFVLAIVSTRWRKGCPNTKFNSSSLSTSFTEQGATSLSPFYSSILSIYFISSLLVFLLNFMKSKKMTKSYSSLASFYTRSPTFSCPLPSSGSPIMPGNLV